MGIFPHNYTEILKISRKSGVDDWGIPELALVLSHAITQLSFLPNNNPCKYSAPLTHYRPAMPFGNRKKYFRGSFQFSIVTIRKISPPLPGNLKFHYLGVFQSLKWRISVESPFHHSLKLNFTPNILGCYGLITPSTCHLTSLLISSSYQKINVGSNQGQTIEINNSNFEFLQFSGEFWISFQVP